MNLTKIKMNLTENIYLNKNHQDDKHERVNMTKNILFWSYSPIHAYHCGNIYYIFGQVHYVKIRCCQLLGHVHRFLSYSLGQLDSVK